MEWTVYLGIFILGLAAGVVPAWIVCRSRLAAERTVREMAESRVLDQTGLVEKREAELTRLHAVETELREDLARSETERELAVQRGREWHESLSAAEALLENLRREESRAKMEAARLQAELDATRNQLTERTAFLEKAEQTLGRTFADLSGQALKGAQTQFFEMARQGFREQRETSQVEMDKRKEAVAALVKPVGETLEKLQTSLNSLETSREGAYRALLEQVNAVIQGQSGLQKETSRLVQALRTPTGRGQWGELQLKRVVEMAGMVEYCDFVTQQTHNDGDGNRLRPDVIVRLPGGRSLIIDSKSPMDAYLRALECDNEDERRDHLSHHARQVKSHLNQLGGKDYWSNVPGSPEFVVLFLPSEAFFQAALEADPTLIQCGVDRNVIPATPTTLIALLRAVAYGWRQEMLADNARRISEVGTELYDRCVTLTGYFSDLGRNLQRSVESYNKAIGSFDSRVVTGARALKALGIAGKKELPDLAEITALPRQSRAALESAGETNDREESDLSQETPEK